MKGKLLLEGGDWFVISENSEKIDVYHNTDSSNFTHGDEVEYELHTIDIGSKTFDKVVAKIMNTSAVIMIYKLMFTTSEYDSRISVISIHKTREGAEKRGKLELIEDEEKFNIMWFHDENGNMNYDYFTSRKLEIPKFEDEGHKYWVVEEELLD